MTQPQRTLLPPRAGTSPAGVRAPVGTLRVLDLFSGIGGFSLGLERAGMKTVAFCEIEPFCRSVLAKHWPEVPCYDDVRTLSADRLDADGISVDVICGGFPCQDISLAGSGAGLAGARSGLWKEYARIIGEIRPSYAIVENVAALLGRGLGVVLGDLAALGYDAEWHCILASAIGAPHRRDRVWIVGNAIGEHVRARLPRGFDPADQGQPKPERPLQDMAYPQHRRLSIRRRVKNFGEIMRNGGGISVDVTEGLQQQKDALVANSERRRPQSRNVECTEPQTIIPAAFGRHRRGSQFGEAWRLEPDVGRVAHGVSDQVDRIKGLGNAVVPQIPEIIGRAIMASLP